ncbi:hypothetical protein PG997_007092 [Apiospora hydei]|uniref:F-box domain-containing protein n=1 Tax=Apiospora hydei TaxID=1337664 RepID=A0ABR1WS19_9PEZI
MAQLQLLADLPSEVLGQIVSHLDPAADKPSLARLALASRRFHALATPVLYHTVKVGHQHEKEGVRDQFLAFLRTVLSSPDDLAPRVRRFHVEGPPAITDPGPFLALVRTKQRPDNPVALAWEAVVIKREDQGPMSWGQYVCVLLALLLPRVAALRSIGFCGFGSDDGLEVLRGLDAVAHFTARWPSVKHVYSAGYIDLDGGELLGGDYRLLEPASSSLESLILGPCSQLHHEHLDALLRAPRALRTFHYNVGHVWAWTEFRTDLLQKSIEHQKTSLQELSVTHNYCQYGPEKSEASVVGPISFAACAALRVLEVSLPYVFGEDVVCLEEGTVLRAADPSGEAHKGRVCDMLPQSVETVRFARCGGGETATPLDRALLEVVRAVRAGEFPHLRTVEVHISDSYRGEMEYADMVERMEKSFRAGREAGLAMELVRGGRLSGDEVDGLV